MDDAQTVQYRGCGITTVAFAWAISLRDRSVPQRTVPWRRSDPDPDERTREDAPMADIQRFDHVGITVADLDEATAFFVGLGLEVEGRAYGPRARA